MRIYLDITNANLVKMDIHRSAFILHYTIEVFPETVSQTFTGFANVYRSVLILSVTIKVCPEIIIQTSNGFANVIALPLS